MRDRIKIKHVETLSDDWHTLKKTTFDYRRSDGAWQTLSRETYGRSDVAVILLYNKAQKTVILTRQFRFGAYVCGHPEMLIEACAGMLDGDDPETCIIREAEEEAGYRIKTARIVFEAFMNPGAMTERFYFFVGEYTPDDKVSAGGGLPDEGEDIEVLEIPFADALQMIERGEILDGKTILLLQYASIHRLLE